MSPYYLNLMRCASEGVPGGLSCYLLPPEENLTMLINYRRALESGHITREVNPLLFYLAVHHLSYYIFSLRPADINRRGGRDEALQDGIREAGRQMLKALILRANPATYFRVCTYVAPRQMPCAEGSNRWAEGELDELVRLVREGGDQEVQVPFAGEGKRGEELQQRWKTLLAICASDEELFAKVKCGCMIVL